MPNTKGPTMNLRDKIIETMLAAWMDRYQAHLSATPRDHVAALVDAAMPTVEAAIAEAVERTEDDFKEAAERHAYED